MRLAAFSLSAALLAMAGAAQAQIYRCEGSGGVVEYTNAPPAGPQTGRTCKTIDPAITVIPAPKTPVRAAPPPGAGNGAGAAGGTAGAATGAAGAGSAGSKPAATSPDGFPKIDPTAQRTRDSDRRRILEDELKKEEGHLAEVKKEYNNGEPERLGDERNYQKYLDRVQRLKDDIQRTEGNLTSIRRELGALKN